MRQEETDLDYRIANLLKGMREIAPRDPDAFARGRANFLKQARSLALLSSLETPVSAAPKERLMEWINSLHSVFQRKEQKPMFGTVLAVLVSLTLIFGGAGATVYAAQGSMPDGVLYPVKTLGENLQLQLANQTQTQLALALEFANRRGDEMVNMSDGEKPIPSEVATRMQQHIEFALQLAAGMADAEMRQALEQIRMTLQNQERMMAQLQNSQTGNTAMEQLQLRLREQLHLTEMGLSDPQGFRQQIQLRNQSRRETQQGVPEESPSQGNNANQPGAGQPVVEPQQNGNNIVPQASPEPGSGLGPGPQASPEPGSGPGPGPQVSPEPGSGSGLGPQASPEPGSGPGPGPQTSPGAGNGSGSGSGTGGDGGPSQGEPSEPSGPDNGGGSGNGNGGHP